MSSSAKNVQSNQSVYTPAPGTSWVYTIFDLSRGHTLYVGVTSTSLTRRMQAHIFAMKSASKTDRTNLAFYYIPDFIMKFDASKIINDSATMLQIGNFLVIAHSCPTKDRYKVEALLIAGMSFLPCNKGGRDELTQLGDQLKMSLQLSSDIQTQFSQINWLDSTPMPRNKFSHKN